MAAVVLAELDKPCVRLGCVTEEGEALSFPHPGALAARPRGRETPPALNLQPHAGPRCVAGLPAKRVLCFPDGRCALGRAVPRPHTGAARGGGCPEGLPGAAGRRAGAQRGQTPRDPLSATRSSQQDWEMEERKLPFSQFCAWLDTLIALIGVSG